MIQLLADHCFDENLLRGIRRKHSRVDILLARDVGLAKCSIPKIRGRMAERFLREARSEPGGNLGKVVEGE